MTRLFTALLSRRGIIAAGLALLLIPAIAQAQDLNTLRASGALAERYDGFVVVCEASPDAQAVADRANAERRALYQRRATEQGVTADEVGRVYAAEIIKKAPAGTWFLNEDGSWIRR